MRTWFGIFGGVVGLIACSAGLIPGIARAQASSEESDASPDSEEPPSVALHLEWEGPGPEAITLRRGPGMEPIVACAPPCQMALPRGHYRVTIADGALRTAFHLDEPVHRIRIVRESRGDLRSVGQWLGVFAGGGFVTAIVMALIGAGFQELGTAVRGSAGSAAGGGAVFDDFMIPAGIGLIIGLTFGGPAFGLSLLGDRWDAHAY